MVDEIVQVSGL